VTRHNSAADPGYGTIYGPQLRPPSETTQTPGGQPTAANAGVLAGHSGGGCEIRTREGLPPTRFPTMLTSVHRRPPPSVTWADRNGCVLADVGEPRRMRPHLRPATGRPLPAAWTSSCGSHGSATHSLATGPRGLMALPGAEPAVTIAGWQICPAQVSRASGHTASLAVAHDPCRPAPADFARAAFAAVMGLYACTVPSSARRCSGDTQAADVPPRTLRRAPGCPVRCDPDGKPIGAPGGKRVGEGVYRPGERRSKVSEAARLYASLGWRSVGEGEDEVEL
jgi:hypothetical protein